MRSPLSLVVLTILAACSKPKTDANQLTNSAQNDTMVSVAATSDPGASLSYIGYIQKFEDNNYFYTDLYFVDNFDYNNYDEVTRIGNATVFQDEETKRTKIPVEKAAQYFNLQGLDNITIYSDKNVKLTSGRLHHIEFVEDIIESYFVAVFEVADPGISSYSFCIGNASDDLTAVEFTPLEDDTLRSELIRQLKLNTELLWNMDHHRLNDQSVYSTVSADTTSFIIETSGSTHRVLYKSKASESISALSVITKEINGRPVLLTHCGMPETDMTWTSLLIFNGTEYEVSRDHRIKRQNP